METLTRPLPYRFKSVVPILFVLGIVVLAGTWAALYWAESLFTESHLVGYYCCVTEGDLPTPGTLERTVSDFFRTSPGMHLPSAVLVAANVCFFVLSLRRWRRHYWWLPFLFAALNVLYLWLEFELVTVSWSISNWLVDPQTSAYKGFERTWYGILLHLMGWGALYLTLWVVVKRLLPESQAV